MNLVETLKAETESLRLQFLEMNEAWAKKEFAQFESLAVTSRSWESFATPGFVKGTGFNSIDYTQGKNYRKFTEARHAAKRTVEAGLDTYLAKTAKNAEQHYQDSILKLAARIITKGLIEAAITMKTGHVGVNIETVMTDGVKTVKAWTIIASGEVQRPHYRYLVK